MKKRFLSMTLVVAIFLSMTAANISASDIGAEEKSSIEISVAENADIDVSADSNEETTEEIAEVDIPAEASDVTTEVAAESDIPQNVDSEQESFAEVNSQDLNIIYSSLMFQFSDTYSGLCDVIDLDNLQIGGKIQVFDYLTDGLVKSETTAYPLYSGATLCAIAFVASDVAQIDTQIAAEIVDVPLSGNSVALLYDATSLYIYDGSEYKVLHVYDPVEGRAYLQNDDPIGAEYVGNINLAPQMDLAMTTAVAPHSTNATTVYLDVGFQTQGKGDRYCWACTDASIGNYLSGYTISGLNFAKYYYTNYNQAQKIDVAISLLNKYYKACSVITKFPYTVYNSIATIDQIKYFLDYSHPIYGEFSSSANWSNKHAVVIRGADTYNGYISFMDPDEGRYYRSASMAYMGDTLSFKFTDVNNNTAWYLSNSAYPNYWA